MIGGSFAVAAKRAGLIGEVVGFGRSRENLEVAMTRGLVDRVSQDPLEAARGADLLLLAVPVAASAGVAASMAGALAPGAIVTDAGSVKARVVREVSAVLPSGMHFVGAHPIAGTAESGAGAAQHDLYEGSRCIVTPTAASDESAVAKVEALWRGVGARVERLSPERHDEVLAWVSHVPHLLAYSLMATAPADAVGYAGPSFRDVTRVAASPVDMWRDILLYNDAALGASLDAVLATLHALREAIARGDAETASAILARGREARRAFEGRKS